jgi:hypothetical protein
LKYMKKKQNKKENRKNWRKNLRNGEKPNLERKKEDRKCTHLFLYTKGTER